MGIFLLCFASLQADFILPMSACPRTTVAFELGRAVAAARRSCRMASTEEAKVDEEELAAGKSRKSELRRGGFI